MKTDEWEFLHVGLIVKDAEKTVEFYRDLGFELLRKVTRFDKPLEQGGTRTTFIGVMGKGGGVLEILQPLEGKWCNREFLETVGEGVNHIAFRVKDLEKERARLTAMGFPVILDSGHYLYFDVRRVGGLIFELTDLAPAYPKSLSQPA